MSRTPGEPIRVEMTKWGDRPHWAFDGLWLGSDAYGEWLGFPVGTPHARPGFAFDSAVDTVTLVPRDAHWIATFHATGLWCEIYIDIATPARWDGDVLRAVDLDLDVVRLADPMPTEAHAAAAEAGRTAGEVYIDDEDEFLEHQASYGYPAEVVAAARASADQLFAAVRAHASPYDAVVPVPWLEELARLTS